MISLIFISFFFCSIWNHLVRLSTDHGRTVIITTHYIEEARQAHTVSAKNNAKSGINRNPLTL